MLRLLSLCAVAAIGTLFAAVPAQAERVCLKPVWNDTFGSWVNTCNLKVYVNWDDGARARPFYSGS